MFSRVHMEYSIILPKTKQNQKHGKWLFIKPKDT